MNACYDCQYNQLDRISDFTVGGFWNTALDVGFDHRKGVSLVLANTPKALRILKALEKEASFVGVDIEKAIIGNRALVKKTPYAKERDDLFHCLRNEGYEKAAKKYFRPETRLSFRLRNLVPQSMKKKIKKVLKK